MLHRYAFLVKNLRGVFCALPGDDVSGYVSWLSRKFRYRDLGLHSCMVKRFGDVIAKRLRGNPFHVLDYPTARVRAAAEQAAKILSSIVDECVAHSILLASSYASPLLVTGAVARQLVEKGLVVYTVKGPKLDANSAKLHLRIVDYTVLDFYIPVIDEMVKLIASGASPEDVHKRRRELAEKDARRYWRFAGKGDIDVVLYIDHVSPLLEKGLGKLLAGEEERVLLAFIAGFNLDSVI